MPLYLMTSSALPVRFDLTVHNSSSEYSKYNKWIDGAVKHHKESAAVSTERRQPGASDICGGVLISFCPHAPLHIISVKLPLKPNQRTWRTLQDLPPPARSVPAMCVITWLRT